MKNTLTKLLLLTSALMILPPPSPFLDAKDLNSRYASQVRKLSNTPFVTDGDAAFYKVDTRRPAHELEAGVVADAVNKRFEDGRAWPRFGVDQQAWGSSGINLIPPGTVWATGFFGTNVRVVNPTLGFPPAAGVVITSRLVPGHKYLVLYMGNATEIATTSYLGVGKVVLATRAGQAFICPAGGIIWFNSAEARSGAITAIVTPVGASPRGYRRFNDPQGVDTQVLTTDDWRDGLGEDGGRGRVWRIISGNVPSPVPLNGHDVYGTARFIPCYNGLTLLRQDNERHYFSALASVAITNSDATGETLTVDTTTVFTGQPVSVSGITGASASYYARVVSGTTAALYDTAAHAVAGGGTGRFNVTVNGETGLLNKLAVDPATSRIQLNTEPNWADGDLVFYWADAGGAILGSTPPNPRTQYYVKTIAGNLVELYTDAALTTKLSFTTAQGRFYLERQADFPGFYGNGAPPLLAQPAMGGETLWDTGFNDFPVIVQVTGTNNTTNVVTAPNHRLLPGDAVTLTGVHTTGPALITTAFACPTSADTLTLYTSALAALAAGASGLIPLVSNGETGTIVKSGASGLPTPPGREGCYVDNRLVIVNGRDTLVISDPLDPLHYTPFMAAVTANLGESDLITFIIPFGNDSLLIGKENSIELLQNLSGGPTAWTLVNITREYGCIAPLSVAQTGNDVWFLSRKGVASVTQTIQGVVQGVALPVSGDVQKYIDQIDWLAAPGAAGEYWNNRYFVAVPLKNQGGSATAVNNGVLVHNFLNAWTRRRGCTRTCPAGAGKACGRARIFKCTGSRGCRCTGMNGCAS